MWSKLKGIFESNDDQNESTSEQRKQLACAALMIEVATIDEHFDATELETLKQHLMDQFDLNEELCDELCDLAVKERHDAVSLHQFTRQVNEQCDLNEKLALLRGMWSIAYSDGNLDKYEEHIIRRAADLLHLNHSEFIQSKLDARPN